MLPIRPQHELQIGAEKYLTFMHVHKIIPYWCILVEPKWRRGGSKGGVGGEPVGHSPFACLVPRPTLQCNILQNRNNDLKFNALVARYVNIIFTRLKSKLSLQCVVVRILNNTCMHTK